MHHCCTRTRIPWKIIKRTWVRSRAVRRSSSPTRTVCGLQNFKARLHDEKNGEPFVSDSAGGLKWDPMQIDMDKSALDKISQVNLESLLAVTGMSS